MQEKPLLEQLDWCFSSANWISDYPNTLLLPLARTIFGHIPSMVQIETAILRAHVFRFENYWVEWPEFLDVVQAIWSSK
jgi:hypothetical protein